ncbi:hypothetical protein V1291_000073 [Nitrobacteraceae bacterium AZCC 1564]
MPTDWDRPLEKPIIRKDGTAIVTLRDAANYLLKLPKAKQSDPLVQSITRTLIDAAEGRTSMQMAQAAATLAMIEPAKKQTKVAKKNKAPA